MRSLDTFLPDWVSPPGATIQRLMFKLGYDHKELANEIDIPDNLLLKILNGDEVITKDIAIRLSNFLGSTPEFWLNREKKFRDEIVRLEKTSQHIDDLNFSWASSFPINEMKKLGWLPAKTNVHNVIENIKSFFNIKTANEWNNKYFKFNAAAAFRTSPTYASNPAAVTAWLRWAEIKAGNVECSDWNVDILKSNIQNMRKLTRRRDPALFIPDLQRICSNCGIALTIIQAPKGCKASGATRFLSDKKAQIVLSLRYKSDDHFWFTFFHEIGHLILHRDTPLFLEDNSDVSSKEEMEANLFSEQTLIPECFKERLRTVNVRTKDILRLATQIGISSGIVIGQLQHSGRVKASQMNHLKRRYKWNEFH